jgi:hypothetical protein
MYEYRTHNVITTLNKKFYKIIELVPPIFISLISSKQFMKVISQTGNFFFFVFRSQSEQKVVTTSITFAADLSTQYNKVDNFVEEYKYIFSSSTGVPIHF